jgi:prevent-host-death family protein
LTACSIRDQFGDVPKVIDIAVAKATLSKLVDAAIAGDEIVIARDGEPLVRLTPVAAMQPRTPGAVKHWKIPDDAFLKPLSKRDQAWLEGEHTDGFGISKPKRKPQRSRVR